MNAARLVILGAGGDLTGRYLLPALADLIAADCAPPIDNELTPEVVEPRPTDSEGGCAGSTSPGLTGLLLSLAWRAHERSRPTRTRPL